MPEFVSFPKIYRFNREVIVTEKVNGTNAAIQIPEDDSGIFAQSRKRLITVSDDNFGFARWVSNNAENLKAFLGYGTHFGEWYGLGIQKNELKIDSKRFMLFNVGHWGEVFADPDVKAHANSFGLELATIAYQGLNDSHLINDTVDKLRQDGSIHVPGGKAEGVVIYHTATGTLSKILCENDEGWKGN